jgi:hypothetical protein
MPLRIAAFVQPLVWIVVVGALGRSPPVLSAL